MSTVNIWEDRDGNEIDRGGEEEEEEEAEEEEDGLLAKLFPFSCSSVRVFCTFVS